MKKVCSSASVLLLRKLLIIFSLLWLITTLLFLLAYNYYEVNQIDTGMSIYINLLIFDATIFAPIAAFLFFENWKEEVLFRKKLDLLEESIDLSKTMAIEWVNNRYDQNMIDSIFLGNQIISELDLDLLQEKIIEDFHRIYKYSDELFYLNCKILLMNGKVDPEYTQFLEDLKKHLDEYESDIEALIDEIKIIKSQKIQNYKFNQKSILTMMRLSFKCDEELSKKLGIKPIKYKDFIEDTFASIVPRLHRVRQEF